MSVSVCVCECVGVCKVCTRYGHRYICTRDLTELAVTEYMSVCHMYIGYQIFYQLFLEYA